MPIFRLAYTTLFLIALLAVFELWGRVGGQAHLELIPWYWKLGLGAGTAYACVKAAAAAASGKYAWNGATLRWCGILLILILACGLASYYVHVYGEDDENDDDESVNSAVAMFAVPSPPMASTVSAVCARRRSS